jgi:hypothetical protein
LERNKNGTKQLLDTAKTKTWKKKKITVCVEEAVSLPFLLMPLLFVLVFGVVVSAKRG